MPDYKHRIEERSFFLPKRLECVLSILVGIAKEKTMSTTQLADLTGHSRGWILATCLGLKRYGLVDSKRGNAGGYWLVKSAEETTVGEVIEAISKTDNHGKLTKIVHNFLVGKAKELTIKDLIDEV